MSKFEIGDIVRVTTLKYFDQSAEIISEAQGSEGFYLYALRFKDGAVFHKNEKHLKLITKKENMMSSESDKELLLLAGQTISKKEKAMRFNSNKAEFFDVPLIALAEVAKVSVFGRAKYLKYNWKKKAPASQYFDCIKRHSLKYWYGQDIDSDSKCHHLAHIAWNALASLEKILTGTEMDDRYKGYPQGFIDNIEDLFLLNDEQKEAIQRELDKKEQSL